jgi:tRNA C32,U32 (ribose-2'-O)-methylase TrmJ
MKSCARAALALGTYEPRAAPLAEPGELERLYEHLATVLEQIDFRDRTERGTHLMNRIRRFVQRAEPDANEVNILRGILTAVQQRRRRAGEAREASAWQRRPGRRERCARSGVPGLRRQRAGRSARCSRDR